MVDKQKIILFLSICLLLCVSSICYAVKLFSIFHCVHYSHVKDKIKNPVTENQIFPDTLMWSSGGEERFGLRLSIHCERNDRIYKSGDLIGIRSGILNCSNEDKYLATAHYSPNKHRIPPEYTLYIDGPVRAAEKEKRWGYLGDDVIFVGQRAKPNLIKVSPGEIFNPSPDSLYYNTWNGILHLTESGTYRTWCSYEFDSLTSNIPVDGKVKLYSDTIEVIVRWNPCAGCWRRWGQI